MFLVVYIVSFYVFMYFVISLFVSINKDFLVTGVIHERYTCFTSAYNGFDLRLRYESCKVGILRGSDVIEVVRLTNVHRKLFFSVRISFKSNNPITLAVSKGTFLNSISVQQMAFNDIYCHPQTDCFVLS